MDTKFEMIRVALNDGVYLPRLAFSRARVRHAEEADADMRLERCEDRGARAHNVVRDSVEC